MQRHQIIKTSLNIKTPAFRRASVRVLVALFVIVGMALTGASSVRAQTGLGIAAVVNEEVISILDLEARITLAIALSNITNTTETRNRLAPQVLRALIDEKLQQQEARRLEIKVPSEEVAQGIQFLEKQNNMPPGQIEKIITAAGLPMSVFFRKTEIEIAWQSVVRKVLRPRVRVGADEVDDIIEQIKGNAGKPEYLLSELYLPVDQPSDEENVRLTAIRLLDQIAAGAPFGSLVRNFSASPSAAVDGDLGWVLNEDLDSDLQKVVIAMTVGQTSKPVRALGGYYILLLRDIRTGRGLDGKTTLKLSQFHQTLKANAGQSGRDDLVKRLKAETLGIVDCKQFDEVAKKSGSRLSGSLGKIEISALPDNMRSVLENLALNKPSKPVETGGGFAVMMICERKVEEVNMERVKMEINNRLGAQRLQIANRRFLLDLRRAAFVDVRL